MRFIAVVNGNKSRLIDLTDPDLPEVSIIHPYEQEIPTIFIDEVPGVIAAYFSGPWLPMSYGELLREYFYQFDYPLQVLEIPERRRELTSLLLRLSAPQQLGLFNRAEELENLLDGLLALKKEHRPLYQRWQQKVKEKIRQISTPQKPLESLLVGYVKPIIDLAPCHSQCHGGEKGFSVEKSLRSHLPLGTVLSFDLADAFGNAHMQYVFDFYYRLLEDKIEDPSLRRDLSGFLTSVSTVNYTRLDSGLPQGSPISTSLYNRMFYPVDDLFHRSALKRNLRYTRWVDDIVISARETNRNPGKLFGAVSIVRSDFPVAVNKIFFQQNVPEVYLLGHKILGNVIVRVNEEESKNRGTPVPFDCVATDHESSYEDMWTDDYLEQEGNPPVLEDEDIPF